MYEGTHQAFRRIVVAVDLTAFADRVVRRVAHLPLASNAHITLLHVVPGRLSAGDARVAERDAVAALAEEAEYLSQRLPGSTTIDSVTVIGDASSVIAERALALRADLVVMGRGSGRAVRDAFLGSTAERVVRRAQLPVLVVRKPARSRYQRPAVAIDVDQTAHNVVTMMLRLLPPPRPPIVAIHAYDIPYESIIYPSLSHNATQHHRAVQQQHAVKAIESVVVAAMQAANAARDAERVDYLVRQGSSREVLTRTIAGVDADIVALGTHGRAGLAHAFLGTVAGDVLRMVHSDVLVVPPPALRNSDDE